MHDEARRSRGDRQASATGTGEALRRSYASAAVLPAEMIEQLGRIDAAEERGETERDR